MKQEKYKQLINSIQNSENLVSLIRRYRNEHNEEEASVFVDFLINDSDNFPKIFVLFEDLTKILGKITITSITNKIYNTALKDEHFRRMFTNTILIAKFCNMTISFPSRQTGLNYLEMLTKKVIQPNMLNHYKLSIGSNSLRFLNRWLPDVRIYLSSKEEVIKNARILCQLQRMGEGVFSNFPDELYHMIAAYTSSSAYLGGRSAEELAAKHFNKPSLQIKMEESKEEKNPSSSSSSSSTNRGSNASISSVFLNNNVTPSQTNEKPSKNNQMNR